MKKNITILIFIILLVGSIFLVLYNTNDSFRSLTFNLINLRLSKSERFINNYVELFNQTFDEMNQCIIRCPLLPRVSYIAEDCIIRCDEKKNETLTRKLSEKYSMEEISEYRELDKIKELDRRIEPLYECTSNCGRILLQKNCVNSCLFPFDK